MKVIDKIKQGPTISVEIEPPELGKSVKALELLLDPLVDQGVSYIDITYHAESIVDLVSVDGYAVPIAKIKKPGTAGVAGFIKARYGLYDVEPVPHVIGTRFTPYATEEFLVELSYLGIENILVLRGDPPQDTYKTLFPGALRHANELIQQVVALRKGCYVGAKEGTPLDFCIGAACYPEKHKESRTWEDEFRWLKAKVDAGADYFVTQLFFDNSMYKKFVQHAQSIGITIPIIPGLQPLTRHEHLNGLPALFECTIPLPLQQEVEKYKQDKARIRQIGIDWCVSQCQDLQNFGVPGLHFYAMRNSPIKEILERLD